MNAHYVYAHLLPNGIPFYIGRGKGTRVTETRSRSVEWYDVVTAHCGEEKIPKYAILYNNLNLQESKNLERFQILLWGRSGYHPSGCLVNKTDGGEGTEGYSWTPLQRVKISGTQHHKFGKTKLVLSILEREEISKKRNTSVVIMVSPAGEEISVRNQIVFSEKYKLDSKIVNRVINGKFKSTRGWTLKK